MCGAEVPRRTLCRKCYGVSIIRGCAALGLAQVPQLVPVRSGAWFVARIAIGRVASLVTFVPRVINLTSTIVIAAMWGRAAALERCAERIYYRLRMWSQPPARRPKSPMPPASALESLGVGSEHWRYSEDLKALSRFAAQLAVAWAPNLFDAGTLLDRPYTDRPTCAIATPSGTVNFRTNRSD